MRVLKENTATRVTVGPFYDVTDGVTPEIALTVTNCLLTFVVDDAGVPTLVIDAAPTASGGSNDMVHITSDAAGYYDLELTAAQTNYTGRAVLSIHDTDVHLPVFHEFQIVSANVYDSLYTDGDVLDTNVTTIAANAITATAINADAITAAKIADNALANEHFADGALTSVEVTSVGSVDNITVGSGGIATIANSDTTVTTGTETLTYTATAALDLSYHEIAPSGSVIDMYYEFDVGSSGVPISVDWTGFVNTINDNVEVSFLNWPSTYDQVGTIAGSVADTVQTSQFLATTAHVGTGANVGKVRLKFSSDGGDVATNLATDRILCTYTQAASGIANGSTITLSATTSNTNLDGENWNLALGGQDISGTYIHGAAVSGVSSGSTAVTFEHCILDTGTYPPGTYRDCGIKGTFTAASAGQYFFDQCYSGVAGSGSPTYDFSGKGSATGINNRGWKGGSSYTLDTNCTLSHEVLAGGGTTITPADAEVEVRGTCRSLTLALADTDIGNTIQCIVDTGPISITSAGSGDSSTINLYGHAQGVTDGSSGGTTVNDYMSGFVQTDAILTDTADIQPNYATSAELAKVPKSDGTTSWNATALAAINAEADTALTDYGPATAANVNTEMLDVLQTDTFAELAGVPAATSSLKDKITWLFMLARNQLEQTSTTQTIRADDTTTSVATSTVSDSAGTATRGEFS